MTGCTPAWEEPRAFLLEQSPDVCANGCAPLRCSWVICPSGTAESHLLAVQAPTPALAHTAALTPAVCRAPQSGAA